MTGELFEVVSSRLATMGRYVTELSQRLPADEVGYLGDRDRQLAVERLCQLIVECTIDTNALLLDILGQPPPQSAREGFDEVERAGILDAPLAQAFRATFVGLRHRLVHDYERLDNRIIYRSAQRLLEAARAYMVAVHRFLETRTTLGGGRG